MRILLLLLVVAFASCSQTIYVVRHGEKATPAANASQAEKGNPDLSAEGNARAIALQQRLGHAGIKSIYSTNYKRTIQTVTPLANATGLTIVTYHPSFDSLPAFAERIKSNRKGNIVIVGHSNTIDNITNTLVGSQMVLADIPETDYNNLFIITRKGKKYSFKAEKYGK
jgi:2,3-bisphosphoglycerate-dependent phosphoglycerate mutase